MADGWGYIWGESGQTWTSAKQRAATRETTIKYGSKWIGHRVSDCSGLAYWAFRQLGGTMYHGSNTIWNQYVTGRCELKDGKRTDGEPMLPGDPVFLVQMKDGEKNRHHIGYWCGDTVIEAKSTYYGVVTSTLTQWHETAHWVNVEYEGGQIFVQHPTLRKGDSGPDVVYLQTLLCSVGDPITVDGKFGSGTEKAVKDFQKQYGLTDDGVVGQKTWAELYAATGHDEDPDIWDPDAPEIVTPPAVDGPAPALDTVTVSRDDWNAIRAAVAVLSQVVKKYESVG